MTPEEALNTIINRLSTLAPRPCSEGACQVEAARQLLCETQVVIDGVLPSTYVIYPETSSCRGFLAFYSPHWSKASEVSGRAPQSHRSNLEGVVFF